MFGFRSSQFWFGVEVRGRQSGCCIHGPSPWKPKKPFDLRERLFEFGLLIVRVVQFLHTRGPIGVAVSYQILNAVCPQAPTTRKPMTVQVPADSIAKTKIVLRELQECRWRLRVVRAAGILTLAQDPVIVESDELVRIVSTIIRNAASRDAK
jgi:hypothetical protein